MKEIMTRAWEIYRQLNGTHKEKISKALKMAWAETKVTKQAFEKTAKVLCRDNWQPEYGESGYLTFNRWEKGGKSRIYINDYKRRTLGYIENGNVIINDRQGYYQTEIDYAINNFQTAYNF